MDNQKEKALARFCFKCSNYDCYGAYNDGEHTVGGCININSQIFKKPINEIALEQIDSCKLFKKNNLFKTVVISGASRGIGRAIADIMAENNPNYDLAIISRHYDEAEKAVKEIKEKNSSHSYQKIYLPYECDISSPEQVNQTFKKIFNDFGSIDILVNNAGHNSRKTIPTKTTSLENWLNDFDTNLRGFDEEIAINLRGTFICSYIGAAYMLKGGMGSVINISSIKGKEPTTSPGYGASKAGIIKLTKDLAKALAPNIRVNCIAPGFIDTGMTLELAEDKKQAYKKSIPLQRFGRVEEIAKIADFLASENASYITGATIDVNGGYLMS
jgi:3-oxoacyl-[acyl-carrier protein] reductase